MNGLRLLVCDLDGTLLDADGTVSPRTEAALDAVREAGVEVAIATGRIPKGIEALVHRLGIDGPQITMHGGLVVDLDTHETVFSEVLRPPQVDELLAVGREVDLPTLLCYPDGFRTNQLRPEVAALFVPYDEPLPVIAADLGELRASHPHKVAIWTGREGYEAALSVVRDRLDDRYAITSGDNQSVEILPRGVDKAGATGELARWLGLTIDQVAAIGDGTNDIELLGTVGHSVAMRHARPEVRAAAAQVIPDDLPDEPASAIGLLFPELVLDAWAPERAGERPA
jgi:Cof subfamily protein (haloacid dehalogenase superfamily)